MKNKILFALAIAGIIAGATAAYLFGITNPPLPPVFQPFSDPYANGIYAEGIVESDQPSGENINVYPEVPGTVKQILVAEGQVVHKGDPLVLIDDSVQRATSGTTAIAGAGRVVDASRAKGRAEEREP